MRNDAEKLKKTQVDWDLWWLRLAREYSTGSKDPSTKVGALIVVNNRLKAAGYNNFPADMNDLEDMYNNRDEKLQWIKHAEIAALDDYHYANDATLYVYPLFPCIECAKRIVSNARITRVVSTDYQLDQWFESNRKAEELFSEQQIQYLRYRIHKIL